MSSMWSQRSIRNLTMPSSFRRSAAFRATRHQQPPEPDVSPWDQHAEGWKEELASDSEAIVKAERHESTTKQGETQVTEDELRTLQVQTTQHLQRKLKSNTASKHSDASKQSKDEPKK